MTDSINTTKEICIGAIKGALGAVPYIGSVLNEAFFETPNRIAQKRKEKHIESVIKKLQAINEDVIDINFIKSEDFSDLLQIILKNITLKNAAEKADFFSNLTVSSMLSSRSKQALEWQIRYIEIIAELNESEMHLLSALHNHRNPSGASIVGVSKPFGMEKQTFNLCFDSLISKGLVFDASLSGMPKQLGTGIGNVPSPRERIDISPLAKATIQFIPEVESIIKKASMNDDNIHNL